MPGARTLRSAQPPREEDATGGGARSGATSLVALSIALPVLGTLAESGFGLSGTINAGLSVLGAALLLFVVLVPRR